MTKALDRRSFVPVDGNDLFDRTPLQVGGFRLRSKTASPIGRPSITQWSAALEFACASHDGSPYWIGDLVSYADTRAEWKERLSQAQAVTGLAEQTLHNLGYISRRLTEEARHLAPSIAHAGEVVALEPAERAAWLDKARTEGWSVRDLRLEIQSSRRRRIIEGQAALEGQYRVWLADPPWAYGDKEPSGVGSRTHYPTMTIEQMCQMPVAAHSTPNAVLFIWVTAPKLLESPGPREVIDAWGFTVKTGMVWHKQRHNFGHYVSVRHEHVIIATRGSCLPDRPTPMIDSVFTTQKTNLEHSEKPEELRRNIERLYDGPYVELFARRRVDGWTCYGNQLAAQVAAYV
jgi:N6-adenosine-specific RNA methylase IME4